MADSIRAVLLRQHDDEGAAHHLGISRGRVDALVVGTVVIDPPEEVADARLTERPENVLGARVIVLGGVAFISVKQGDLCRAGTQCSRAEVLFDPQSTWVISGLIRPCLVCLRRQCWRLLLRQ